MKVTFDEVKEIFDTLPIGYYVGAKVNTVLDMGFNAYHNFEKNEIHVGYGLLNKIFTLIPENAPVKKDQIIRSLLYHETSPAILTPKNLKFGLNSEQSQVVNLVEDERIEQLLKHYYLGVDFEYTCSVLFDNDEYDAFFKLVRLHQGEQKWLDELDYILRKYKNLNAGMDKFGSNPKDRLIVYSYVVGILDFYKRFTQAKKEQKQEPEDNSAQNNNINDDSDDDESTDSDGNESTDCDDNESIDSDDDELIDSDDDESAEAYRQTGCKPHDVFAEDEIDAKELLRAGFNSVCYFDSVLYEKLKEIIIEKSKRDLRNGAAIAGYHGKINPVLVGTKDDYRWFMQENRLGNYKRFSKTHFNLFIDNSGSFSPNEKKMNMFIHTLDTLCSNDFSFDVITMNDDIQEWDTHKKVFEAGGGTYVPNEIWNVVKKHRKPDRAVYNIVLYDGEARNGKNLKAFDTPNTIFISDEENEHSLTGHKKCKLKIINNNYCDVFIDEVIRLLKTVAI